MKVYKLRLQELSRAVERDAIDVLFYLYKIKAGETSKFLAVSGDKVAELAALLNADYLTAVFDSGQGQVVTSPGATPAPHYRLRLSERGTAFVEAWHRGEYLDGELPPATFAL